MCPSSWPTSSGLRHAGQTALTSPPPVLCRAGPGTGKTWLVKQCLILLACALAGENAGEGIRLEPVIVFVQRIVCLL